VSSAVSFSVLRSPSARPDGNAEPAAADGQSGGGMPVPQAVKQNPAAVVEAPRPVHPSNPDAHSPRHLHS